MMRYAKAVVAILIPVAIALNSALNGGDVTSKEIEDVVLAVVGAIGVWAVPNTPALPAPSPKP